MAKAKKVSKRKANNKKPLAGMTYYVAASSKEVARARRVMARIRRAGGCIVHDWTVPVMKYGANPKTATEFERREWANECTDGIKMCDEVVALVPEPKNYSLGLMFELGFAFGEGKLITHVDACDGSKSSVFLAGRYTLANDKDIVKDLIETRFM